MRQAGRWYCFMEQNDNAHMLVCFVLFGTYCPYAARQAIKKNHRTRIREDTR